MKLSEHLKSRLKSKVFRGCMRKVMAVVAKSPDIDSHQAIAFERLLVMGSSDEQCAEEADTGEGRTMQVMVRLERR